MLKILPVSTKFAKTDWLKTHFVKNEFGQNGFGSTYCQKQPILKKQPVLKNFSKFTGK